MTKFKPLTSRTIDKEALMLIKIDNDIFPARYFDRGKGRGINFLVLPGGVFNDISVFILMIDFKKMECRCFANQDIEVHYKGDFDPPRFIVDKTIKYKSIEYAII